MKKTILIIIVLCLFGCSNNSSDNQSETIDSSNSQKKEINIKDYDEGFGIGINENNFPDEKYSEYIKNNFDKDNNDYLSDEEIKKIRSIEIDSIKIDDYKGTENFYNLLFMKIMNVNYEEFDFSNIPYLRELILEKVDIKFLKVYDIGALIITNSNIDNIIVNNDVDDLISFRITDVNSDNSTLNIDVSNCSKLKPNELYLNNIGIYNTSNEFGDVKINKNDKTIIYYDGNTPKQIMDEEGEHRISNIYYLGEGNSNIDNNIKFHRNYSEAYHYGYSGNKWFNVETLYKDIEPGDDGWEDYERCETCMDDMNDYTYIVHTVEQPF